MEKTLFIHIGSPKTGTTAIQGFLKSHDQALQDVGVNFVKTGRVNIAHNGLIGSFRIDQGAKVCHDIADEIAQSSASIHILSSERFFNPAIAKKFALNMPEDLRKSVKIIGYVRRQDRYMEALYKQLVKNGRIPADAMAFYNTRIDRVSYSNNLNAYARQFGAENIILRPFQRDQFPNGDVVSDFIKQTGITLEKEYKSNVTPTNKTFSVEVSEILGMLSTETSMNTRQVIRNLLVLNPKGAICSNDVYDLVTRRAIMAHTAADNEGLREKYCPDLKVLFNTDDLDVDTDPMPDPSTHVTRWRNASQAIAMAIGAQEA